jgi:hypothetical protein
VNLKLVAGLILGSALFASGWAVNGWRKDVEMADIKHAHLKAYTENLQAARDETQRLNAKVKDAQDGYVSRQSRLIADARRSRSVSDGLRDELNAFQRSMPGLTEQAIRRYTEALGIVFDQCQAEYGTLAEDAGRSQNAAQALDAAWPQ